MRSKPRKNKDERLSCRKNSKSCLTAKTRVRMPRPFLRRSCASRSRFEAQGLLLLTSSFLIASRVDPAFSYLAAVLWPGEGDFLRLRPFADASLLPFARYAHPSGDYATSDSLHGAHEQHLRVPPL